MKCRVVAKPQQKGKEMGRLYIVCYSKKEESKVLEELEKQGKKWNNYDKPTENSYFSNTSNEYAIVVNGNFISCAANATKSMSWNENSKKISAAEFLKENKETIVIYRNGAETIAFEKNTGKKAVAKCHADDTYSFEIGAKLALERLFPETVREVSRYAEVGEYIKIVNAIAGRGYKNGDILKVEDTTQYRTYVECVETGDYCIKRNEYVVLENYKPEEKPQQYYNGKVVCVEACPLTLVFTKGKIYEFKEGYVINDTGTKNETQMRNFEDIERTFDSKFVELV